MRETLLSFPNRLERWLQSRPFAVATLLVLLACLIAYRYGQAVGGSWYRSGNDMEYILPAARSATEAEIVRWLRGSWIGVELFNYYRPVTSLLWYAQFRQFGEYSAAWQMISLGLHSLSVIVLALLLRRVFGGWLPAFIGAFFWATRPKMFQTIEWTPAQTDTFAVFFGLLALLCWQIALDQLEKQKRYIIFFVFAGILALLAMGSKEIALTVPLLAILLAVRTGLPVRTRLWLSGSALALLVVFFGWRYGCLGGMGFTPGTATPGRSNAIPLTPARWLRQMSGYLLPPALRPTAALPPLAVLACYGTILLVRRLTERKAQAMMATGGFVATTFLLGGAEFLLLPDTGTELATGLLTVAILVFVVRQIPKEALFVVAWGLIAHLPPYHVVYNAAGNVTYLPDTYHAFAAACLTVACLKATAGEAGRGERQE